MAFLNFSDHAHSINESRNYDNYYLVAENLTNDVDNNLKFGIVITTHKISGDANAGTRGRHKVMSTPQVLGELLDSIAKQSFKNWHCYIVGDAYDGSEEIVEVMNKKLGKDKFTFANLSKPGERLQDIPDRHKKITGGTTANNKGLVLAEKDGVDVIAKIDHDDKWTNNHLMELAKVYTQYPKAAFAYTKAAKKPASANSTKKVLYYPNGLNITDVAEDNHMAQPGNASHSAISWRLMPGVKGIRYRGAKDQVKSAPKRPEVIPVDADILDRIKTIIKDKGYNYVYVPKLTNLYRNKDGEFPNVRS